MNYEGFPLYLRKPDYEYVWSYQRDFTNIFCITHKLEKVKQNGLPESDYNKSLFDFDEYVVTLFDQDNKGIIVLIETYGGERHYYFYLKPNTDYESYVNFIKTKFPLNAIETWCKSDKEWNFLKSYSINLYTIN